MSTPARGRGGGGVAGNNNSTTRGRGSGMRGRGRGRGAAFASSATSSGLLQKLRSGTVQRTGENGQPAPSRGRGSRVRDQSSAPTRGKVTSQKTDSGRAASPAPTSSYRDFMAHMTEKFQSLKPRRDAERKKAIQDGILADPDKKTSLANAITPVGTCTEMCPEFERVERIVQNMVDKAEKVPNEASGRDMPSEDRMIKRFRRSAAGYDEQLPSDIRTPDTLRKTLDYLLDRVIGGGERLASIHKFVWDRTRGIRNDFSIQQVSKVHDVQIAIDCFERIARFHILSLHQLSNSNNLLEGEHFDAHQEREQLNNTLLSLMYYYDDNRSSVPLPNEAEFRSYCILFELQALTPDLEERMQSWPRDLLRNPRVQTSFKIYASAGNTIFDQGPLRPLEPFALAQANPGRFWTLLASHEVSYMMACVAEMNFAMVRFTALDALWRSAKSAPQGQQQKNQEWTLPGLTEHLGFDDDEQTLDFVQEFGLVFATGSNGEQYLDITATSAVSLDRSQMPSHQIFSQDIVERKRYHRTLVAVINGVSVASAIRQGLVVESHMDKDDDGQDASLVHNDGIFIPDQSSATFGQSQSIFGKNNLNPQATSFKPASPASFKTDNQASKPPFSTKFGESAASAFPNTGFGQAFSSPSQSNAYNTVSQGLASAQKGFGQPSEGHSTTNQPTNPFKGFIGFQQETPNKAPSVSPSFIFGKPAEAFTPQATELTMSGTTTKPQEPTPQASVLTAGPSSSDVSAQTNTPPASPLSTFFGEKSLKQKEMKPQKTQPVFQTTGTGQNALPTFDFARPSVQSTFAKGEAAKSIFSTSSDLTQPAVSQPGSNSVFNFPRVPSSTISGTTVFSSATLKPAFSQIPTPTIPTSSASLPESTPSTSNQTSATPLLTSTVTNNLETGSTTTPLGSPKRPQLGSLNFPTLTPDQSVKPQSREAQTPSTFTSPKATTPIQSSEPKLVESTPTHPPVESVRKVVDRAALAEVTARLALTQEQGLIEYFIGHHVSKLLQSTVKEYQQDVRETILSYVKTKYLERKFFRIWKDKTRRNVLNRRGQQRRRLLAAAMQAESEKQKRNEEELEAIIAATRETKTLQEEASKRHADNGKQKDQQPTNQLVQTNKLVGLKRKEPANTPPKQSSPGLMSLVEKTHKRSRTLGSFSESTVSARLSSPASNLASSRAANRFEQSFFGRSISPQSLRQSMSSHKVDSTKTDYFKLKAMGIDPDTPLIPDTARTLALRQQRREDERQSATAGIRGRARSTSRLSTPVPRVSDMAPPPRPASVAIHDTPPRPASSTGSIATEEDEFLKSLRDARALLSHDEGWFKSATAELQNEIQTQEDLRLSQSNVSTRRMLASGMARTNGYTYFAAETLPGATLSRTERRIRATGAHGLATRPITRESSSPRDDIGGARNSRHSSSDRREARVFASPGRKREREDFEPASTLQTREVEDESGNITSIDHIDHAAKRHRMIEPSHPHIKPVANQRMRSNPSNMFDTLATFDSEEEEEESNDQSSRVDEDEDNGEEADSESDDQSQDPDEDEELYNADELPDEELVEDEDDEGDDESEDYPTNNFAYPTSRGAKHVSGPDTIGTPTFDQIGPGASADDALVLSD